VICTVLSVGSSHKVTSTLVFDPCVAAWWPSPDASSISDGSSWTNLVRCTALHPPCPSYPFSRTRCVPLCQPPRKAPREWTHTPLLLHGSTSTHTSPYISLAFTDSVDSSFKYIRDITRNPTVQLCEACCISDAQVAVTTDSHSLLTKSGSHTMTAWLVNTNNVHLPLTMCTCNAHSTDSDSSTFIMRTVCVLGRTCDHCHGSLSHPHGWEEEAVRAHTAQSMVMNVHVGVKATRTWETPPHSWKKSSNSVL
jgi:hypothetical protein